MLFQYDFDITSVSWIIGLGITIGMAFVMYMITTDNQIDNFAYFFVWLMIFDGIVVYAGLLPLWTLVLAIIIVSLVLFAELITKMRGVS